MKQRRVRRKAMHPFFNGSSGSGDSSSSSNSSDGGGGGGQLAVVIRLFTIHVRHIEIDVSVPVLQPVESHQWTQTV